jgi:hypothetical protein
MRVRLVRRPGQAGTKKYVDEYGEQLVCVRYRYDEVAKRRYTTVEIIVDEGPWAPALEPDTLVGVRIEAYEYELQQLARRVKARWRFALQLWQLRYEDALNLGLADRIVGVMNELLSRDS